MARASMQLSGSAWILFSRRLAILMSKTLTLCVPRHILRLQQTGAPYLPTFQKNMNAMFSQLRREQSLAHPSTGDGTVHAQLGKFVDLGSGDGRVVFRAAREDMFRLCVGYEINPMLHGWALWQRLVAGPATWRSTRFYRADLWRVDLRDANVVAVVRSSRYTR
jgi:hypothetical protein